MQITIAPDLKRRAAEKAAKLGMSIAEYVRRTMESDLDEPHNRPDVSIIFGLGASAEPTDISRDKKLMIGESHEKKARR
jgi:hypothetical protein